MQSDTVPTPMRGFVRQFKNGQPLDAGHNMVVDSAMELVLLALLGQDNISRILFANTGGSPITSGQRTIINPVGSVRTGQTQDTRPFITLDDGGLRTIGTWTAIWAPETTVTYDTVGLMSENLLMAARTFAPVTLSSSDNIAVQWTLYMRGGQ